MDALRTAIINELKAKFPLIADRIVAYATLLDEQTDAFASYPGGSIFVSILPTQEAPGEFAPMELRANFGVVVTGRGGSTRITDAEGWTRATQVARVIYRNTWGTGLQRLNVAPAVITAFNKNEQRDKDGLPTGNYYWTIVFYNLCRFSAALGEQEF